MAQETLNPIERWGIELVVTKLWNAVNGSKTYILAVLGILVALCGHFWGPLSLAGSQIPKESWDDVWKAVYASGIISAIRHGISKGGTNA